MLGWSRGAAGSAGGKQEGPESPVVWRDVHTGHGIEGSHWKGARMPLCKSAGRKLTLRAFLVSLNRAKGSCAGRTGSHCRGVAGARLGFHVSKDSRVTVHGAEQQAPP